MAKIKESSSKTVTVYCKIPNGIILQNYEMRDTTEPSPNGSRTVKQAFVSGPAIKVSGPARHHGEAPKVPIVFGFALTRSVPADHWERWEKANKDSAMVVNGLIYARADEQFGRDEAKDHIGQRSGLERLQQKDDPRTPRRKGLKIEVAPESNKSAPEAENVEPEEV